MTGSHKHHFKMHVNSSNISNNASSAKENKPKERSLSTKLFGSSLGNGNFSHIKGNLSNLTIARLAEPYPLNIVTLL